MPVVYSKPKARLPLSRLGRRWKGGQLQRLLGHRMPRRVKVMKTGPTLQAMRRLATPHNLPCQRGDVIAAVEQGTKLVGVPRSFATGVESRGTFNEIGAVKSAPPQAVL